MGRTLTYPKLEHTTVHRLNNRATYDLGAIHSIVNTSPVVHVSFPSSTEEPFPAILPMIGQMGSFDYPSAGIDEPMDCYLHGYVTSRLMKLAGDATEGLPVTIAATKVDGLVLALTPFHHSYNYRSAVLYGYAQIVTDPKEKVWAMELITDSIVPERWANSRTPPDSGELSSTSILRVRISSGSGKIRDGGPHDEKKDEGNAKVAGKFWTGVIPLWETLGSPVPSDSNQIKDLPSYIVSYVNDTNKQRSRYAVEAVEEK
ncbi:MAG: hypothetical protein Q9227_001974 [Pyrenula ochraceoflavens]